MSIKQDERGASGVSPGGSGTPDRIVDRTALPGSRRLSDPSARTLPSPRPPDSPEWWRFVPLAAAAGLGALVLLWLLAVGARLGWAAPVARLVLPLALLATAAWGYLRLADCARARRWLIPALLGLSLVVRLAGADHEVSGRYWGDEGTYYRHAMQMNDGKITTRSFVYPHLTYDLYAFALWLAGLFPAATEGAIRALWGVTVPLEREWLILRLVSALLGAFAVVPVALLARRIVTPIGAARGDSSDPAAAGRLATYSAAFAGLLLIADPHFNLGTHLFICDAPSAFFGAVSLAFAGRLLDRERTRDYVAAGIWAGLAAATKYPAGVVAIAIVALWLGWRIAAFRASARGAVPEESAPRRWHWGLLWAGLAAIATFVGVMPSLALYPEIALFGQRGMLFGARQYAFHGWIGVVPHSNAAFYLEILAESFGALSLILGLVGMFALDRVRRGRWLRIAIFPALFLGLLLSMAMVVKRNLYPAMPPLAALLGVGFAAAVLWLAERLPRGLSENGRRLGRAALAGLAVLCVAPAIYRTAIETIGYARATTRDLAVEWMLANLPPGARIVKEQYAPNLPEGVFEIVPARFAARLKLEEIRAAGNDYLLLASDAYKRFLNPEMLSKAHHHEISDRYQTILGSYPLAAEWYPGTVRLGPIVKLFRLEPLPGDCRAGGEMPAREAHVPDLRMRAGAAVAYTLPGQWVLFKGCFEAGRYALRLDGNAVGPGTLRAVDAQNRKILETALGEAPTALDLPRRGKVFVYVYLPEGSRLRSVVLEPKAEGLKTPAST